MRAHDITFRPIAEWPPGWQDANRAKLRLPPPFSATYTDTLNVLDRELNAIGTTNAHLQLGHRCNLNVLDHTSATALPTTTHVCECGSVAT